MEDMGSIHLRLLEGRLREVAYQLTKVQYSSFRSLEAWHPAVNAYRCRDRIVICVDLV